MRVSIRSTIVGAAAGAIIAAAAIAPAAFSPASPADGATKFRASPEQLKINQRIASAAVRRSNLALRLLGPVGGLNEKLPRPGWAGDQIAGGAIAERHLSPEVRARFGGSTPAPAGEGSTSLWALVGADGRLLRGSGARGVTRASIGENDGGSAPGAYMVTFDRDVSQCGLSAQPVATIGLIGVASAGIEGNEGEVLPARSPEQVLVGTASPDTLSGGESGDATNDLSFFLNVIC